jgi:hypothetical protein
MQQTESLRQSTIGKVEGAGKTKCCGLGLSIPSLAGFMPECLKGKTKASVAHDTDASPAENDPSKKKSISPLGTQVQPSNSPLKNHA